MRPSKTKKVRTTVVDLYGTVSYSVIDSFGNDNFPVFENEI